MTRMQKNASNKDGYIWDKVNYNGVIGYVARGDSSEDYIVPVGEESGSEGGNEGTDIPSKNSQVKMENGNVICDAVSNVNTIKSAFDGAVVKDSKGKEITGKTNVGTGYTVTINKKTYTIIKKGDVNGDANINSGDLLKIQKHLLKDADISGTPYEEAADANNDGKLNSGDLLKIQKFLLKDTTIGI